MITNGAQFNDQVVLPQQQQLIRPTSMGQPMLQSSIDGVKLVTTNEEITNYPIAGGATVALIDLGRSFMVFKTNDIYSGRGIYYETYDIKKREEPKPVQNANLQNDEFMSKIQSQIDELKKEYDDIYKLLEGITAPKKEAGN